MVFAEQPHCRSHAEKLRGDVPAAGPFQFA
jgi:hypothetical protein